MFGNRHTLRDLEKGDFLGAVKCLMTSPPKVGIEGAESIWDELQYCHVAQANYIHYVGYVDFPQIMALSRGIQSMGSDTDLIKQ